MATLRVINEIRPIEGADRIEEAVVDGWHVVVGKGEYKTGQLAVYFEIDTFMPTDDERYAFLASRGTKTMVYDGEEHVGHVLKTARLRGVLSQGLLMRTDVIMPDIPATRLIEMAYDKYDVSGIAGVREYVGLMPLSPAFIGKYDNYVAPRTDAERVQNIDQETYDLIRRCGYEVSVKVDGTSITLTNDPRTHSIRAFSHNNEFDVTQPGTGKAAWDAAKRQGILDVLEANEGLTVQAELCGPKIGGNTLGLKDYTLFVFSVWSIYDGRYLSHTELEGHLAPLLEYHVPVIGGWPWLDDHPTPESLLEYASTMRGNVTKNRLDEGLVVHVHDMGDLDVNERIALERTLGPTMQMKAVSNKFLLKKKG